MFKNIFFIGGIHGVGKSTICQQVCREMNIEYLSASELLKWGKINDDVKNKNVEDITFTQNRLIMGLSNTIQSGKYYLLDGHFCLLNKGNEVENISLDTFKQINPITLALILGNITEIKTQLEKRDNKSYDCDLLEHLQNSELSYAKYLSRTLSIPLNLCKNDDYLNILTSLREIIKTN